jgi:hypothetical protein
LEECVLGANEGRRGVEPCGVAAISPRIEELDGLRGGAGDDARFRLAVLELRRNEPGKLWGVEGVWRGECRLGDLSEFGLDRALADK